MRDWRDTAIATATGLPAVYAGDLSWLLVAVLLGYGVAQTVITAAKLFTS